MDSDRCIDITTYDDGVHCVLLGVDTADVLKTFKADIVQGAHFTSAVNASMVRGIQIGNEKGHCL